LDHALAALDQPDDTAAHAGDGETDTERVATPDLPPQRVVPLRGSRAPTETAGRRSAGDGSRGRLIGDRVPDGPVGAVAVAATARAVAERRALDPEGPAGRPADLREARRGERTGNLPVAAVDGSGAH